MSQQLQLLEMNRRLSSARISTVISIKNRYNRLWVPKEVKYRAKMAEYLNEIFSDSSQSIRYKEVANIRKRRILWIKQETQVYEYRKCKMVRCRKRLRIHHPRRWWQRSLCSPLWDQNGRLCLPRRRSTSLLRNRQRTQGSMCDWSHTRLAWAFTHFYGKTRSLSGARFFILEIR